MNIHIKDKALVEQLQTSSVHTQLVGSHLYGLNNKKSDSDILSIYVDSVENYSSFLWGHHQLQYKFKNTDYNYVELRLFIRNILSGDSTVNFEAMYSNDFKKSSLSWLCDFKKDVISYRLIRSYLGFAKRDYKQAKKTSKDFSRIDGSVRKKVSHLLRGVLFAKQLMDGDVDVECSGCGNIISGLDDLDVLRNIKLGEMDDQMSDLSSIAFLSSESIRDNLNRRYESQEIREFTSSDRLMKLDGISKEFISSRYSDSIEYGDVFYSAMTNGIKY